MTRNLANKQAPTKLSLVLAGRDVEQRLQDTLPWGMKAPSFRAQMVIAMRKTEKLRSCSMESQMEATFLCATLGMVPSAGHVALIPRNNSQKQCMEATVMIQWQGYKALMERHPDVLDVTARLVHANDEYSFDGTRNAVTKHFYDPYDPKREIGSVKDLLGGYVKVEFNDGRVKFHIVTAKTIEKARKCAQTQDIWTAWFEEMALKTCYRNAYARRVVPVDSLMEEILERAVEADDDSLGNNPDILESSVVTVEPPRTEDTKAEKMASELNDFSPPAATTIDVPPPTTIDVPVSEITPATDIHPLLAEYAAKLAACRSVNTAQNLWHKYVGDQVMNTDFSDDLMALGTDMRNEKLKALRAKEEATQRELV